MFKKYKKYNGDDDEFNNAVNSANKEKGQLTYIQREFGQTVEHDHRQERNQLIVLVVGFLIISCILLCFVKWGIYILIVLLALMCASIPIFLFVIKVDVVTLLEVDLGEHTFKRVSENGKNTKVDVYKLIDSANLYYIPFHIWKVDYDLMGNMPPFRNNVGQTLYIADYVDKENKIVHLAFDERFSNLRYCVKKGVFIELKNEVMGYIKLELRRLLTQEISIGMATKHALERGISAFLHEPEKFYYDRDFDQNKNDILPDTDTIIDYLRDIKTEKEKELQTQTNKPQENK